MSPTITRPRLKTGLVRGLARICLPVAAFLVLWGCGAAQEPTFRPALKNEGELYLYLQPLPQEAHRLTFTIADLSAVREDDSHVPLLSSALRLECRNLLETQKKLTALKLSPGSYKGLAVTISQASRRGKKGEADLLVPPAPLMIEKPFKIRQENTLALFLSLEEDRITRDGYSFTPTFTLASPRCHMSTLMGFTTNSLSNVVTVFNKHTMDIVDVVATDRGPQGMALDQERGRAYLAATGDDIIEMIDVATGESLGQVKLRLNDEPVDLALSADGRILLSANSGSATASIIDTDSLSERDRIRFETEPSWVEAEPGGGRAYFFHPLTNTISALDMSGSEVTVSRPLDEGVIKGDFDHEEDRLYAISTYSPNLLVIDPATLAVREKILIGGGAVSIRVDPQTGLVYVGKSSGEIAAVDPWAGMIVESFRVGGAPAFLTIDQEENALFAALPEEKKVLKIDLVNKKITDSIAVEEGAHSIVVMGEER
ncbi:MAG: YncE family protein [Desulfurivibrionaceae bacterium]